MLHDLEASVSCQTYHQSYLRLRVVGVAYRRGPFGFRCLVLLPSVDDTPLVRLIRRALGRIFTECSVQWSKG